MYTIEDARREVKELLDEGYGFSGVRIFLNDLSRGRDISWEDNQAIMSEIITGKFGTVDCSITTGGMTV